MTIPKQTNILIDTLYEPSDVMDLARKTTRSTRTIYNVFRDRKSSPTVVVAFKRFYEAKSKKITKEIGEE